MPWELAKNKLEVEVEKVLTGERILTKSEQTDGVNDGSDFLRWDHSAEELAKLTD